MFSKAQKKLIKAKTIFAEKAGKYGDYYTDKKYIRLAGRTA